MFLNEKFKFNRNFENFEKRQKIKKSKLNFSKNCSKEI
jgi:hypothetical protein